MSQSDFSGEPLSVLSLLLLPLPPVVTGLEQSCSAESSRNEWAGPGPDKDGGRRRTAEATQVAYVSSQRQAELKSLSQ